MEKTKEKKSRLIVLDDVHNVFDAEWFNEFFHTALFSLTPETHLIFLSRSKPRSSMAASLKQVYVLMKGLGLTDGAKHSATYNRSIE